MVEFKVLSKEAIARRAYELYVERGGEPGKDVQDWIRAEKELSSELGVGSAKTKTAQAGSQPTQLSNVRARSLSHLTTTIPRHIRHHFQEIFVTPIDCCPPGQRLDGFAQMRRRSAP